MRTRAALVLLVLSGGGCVDGPTDEAAALAVDPVEACAIPASDAIAGHEGDFYRCVDGVIDDGRGCGEAGYLLGYGARYAERFYRATRPRMSAPGQRWIDDVLVCLQEELRASVDSRTSCDEIREVAFDSHPRCYVEAGFCALPLLDVVQVVWTIDVRDWLGSSAARQAVETALACGREHTMVLRRLFDHLLQ